MSSIPFPATLRGQPEAAVLAGLAFLAPILALFSALGIAPLLSVAAAAVLALAARRQSRRSPACRLFPAAWPLDRWQSLALAGLFGWAVAGSFHGPTPTGFALKTVAMTLGTVAAGTAVVQAMRRLRREAWPPVLLALTAGLAAAFAILVALGALWRFGIVTDKTFVTFFFHMDRGATLAALLLWPAVLGLWRQGRPRLAIGLALAAVPALLFSFALAAKVALVAGFGCVLLVRHLPRLGTGILAAAVLGALLLAPLGALHLPPPEQSAKWPGMLLSIHHRMTIWRYAGSQIRLHPLIGWGFEASRSIAGKEEIAVTAANGDIMHEPLMPLHPHNAALQFWLELGGIGAGLMALFLAATILRLRGAPSPLARAYQAAGLAAGTIISLVSFGFWQSWWQCSLWLCAAFLTAASRRTDQEEAVP